MSGFVYLVIAGFTSSFLVKNGKEIKKKTNINLFNFFKEKLENNNKDRKKNVIVLGEKKFRSSFLVVEARKQTTALYNYYPSPWQFNRS